MNSPAGKPTVLLFSAILQLFDEMVDTKKEPAFFAGSSSISLILFIPMNRSGCFPTFPQLSLWHQFDSTAEIKPFFSFLPRVYPSHSQNGCLSIRWLFCKFSAKWEVVRSITRICDSSHNACFQRRFPLCPGSIHFNLLRINTIVYPESFAPLSLPALMDN